MIIKGSIHFNGEALTTEFSDLVYARILGFDFSFKDRLDICVLNHFADITNNNKVHLLKVRNNTALYHTANIHQALGNWLQFYPDYKIIHIEPPYIPCGYFIRITHPDLDIELAHTRMPDIIRTLAHPQLGQ